MTLLPAPPLLGAFVGSSLVLAVTPGPGVVYIVTRTLAQGRTAGLASVLGVALGNLGNALGAALGLAALFALSSAAFRIVQWAGALYLIVLGVQMLRRRGKSAEADPTHPSPAPVPRRRLLRDGALVALLNPKTTLFFAAFLPQFVDAAGSPMAQTLALGAVFVAIAAATDGGYVLLASRLAPALRGSSRLRGWARPVGGASFIALGVAAALARPPSH